MSGIKCIYSFDEEEQYLKIDFLPADSDGSQSWNAYVFDENWTELIGSAASVSKPCIRRYSTRLLPFFVILSKCVS